MSHAHAMPFGIDAARPVHADARTGNGLMLCMLLLPLIGATLLSKFAVPLIHVDGIGLGFPLIYLAMLPGILIAGLMRFDPPRLQFFCFLASVLGCAMAMRGENVSLPSLAFLMLLHLPYVVRMEVSEATRESIYLIFLDLALVIALCGLAQYSLQHFVATKWVFPIENLLPADWRVTGFNMQTPIAWGSSTYRPNGLFMQEPSFFSQLLAIALLLELTRLARLWRIALYGIAIVASQSGTGLIILAFGLPILVARRFHWNHLAALALLLPVLYFAGPWLHIDHLIARLGEFTSTRSSAYERFVGGFQIFSASVDTDPLRMLFGYGAGSYRQIVQNLGMPAAEMALFKMVVEFGVVGATLYFGFMFFCIFRTRGPFVLRLALAVCLFLNGAYNTFIHSLAFALLVWPSSASVRPEYGSRRPRRAAHASDVESIPEYARSA